MVSQTPRVSFRGGEGSPKSERQEVASPDAEEAQLMKGGPGASLRNLDPGGNGLSFLAPLAAAILEKVGRPNLKLQLMSQH